MKQKLGRTNLIRSLLLVAAAIAVNIALGYLVRDVLRWPLYLDSIGTILAGALLGPLAGAATGALTNLIWGASLGVPEMIPYSITAALIGWGAGFAVSRGAFRRPGTVVLSGFLVGLGAALISAPITAYLFGDVTGGGTDYSASRAAGSSTRCRTRTTPARRTCSMTGSPRTTAGPASTRWSTPTPASCRTPSSRSSCARAASCITGSTGTMTRRAQGLDAREPVATVEVHPDEALELGITDGDQVRITSRRNTMLISVRISDRVARRQVFVPFHFREAAANLLTNPVLEPHAKMAGLKVCAVRLEPVGAPAPA